MAYLQHIRHSGAREQHKLKVKRENWARASVQNPIWAIEVALWSRVHCCVHVVFLVCIESHHCMVFPAHRERQGEHQHAVLVCLNILDSVPICRGLYHVDGSRLVMCFAHREKRTPNNCCRKEIVWPWTFWVAFQAGVIFVMWILPDQWCFHAMHRETWQGWAPTAKETCARFKRCSLVWYFSRESNQTHAHGVSWALGRRIRAPAACIT